MNSNANLYDKIVVKGIQIPAETPAAKTYRGFSTISPDANGFSLYDYPLIKQDIINHFHIRQGERLENPTFGTIIWDVLFEPLTDQLVYLIKTDVERIIRSDPRVNPVKIMITQYDQGLQIDCLLQISPYNVTETMRLTFDQNNGLFSK